MSVVVFDYNDLIAGVDLTSQIEEAYGYNGIGLLTVKNVPGLPEARATLLPLAKEFSDLSEETKEKYVHEESCYSFGWSHGKEKLEGRPDLSKGSYYANPIYDRPVDDEELIKKHAPFIHPNIWPTDDLPEMEPAFKSLGQLIVHVGGLVAQQADGYIKKQNGNYEENKLHRIIGTSRCCKARLLHYFSRTEEELAAMASAAGSTNEESFSSWCGWHNDHGSLTGLVSAMFLDESGNLTENKSSGGLYARSRAGNVVKVAIPVDHIAFQIGEAAQIQSGGILQVSIHTYSYTV